MKQWKLRGGGIFRSLLVILFLLLCSPLTVSAMNRQVIPDSYKDYSLSGRLELTANKYKSHAWYGVAGQVRDSTSISSTVPNTFGSKLFTIPTVRTGFTYTDFLDIEFENVAEVAGRSLNATLHVDSVIFGPAQRNTVDNSNFASAQAGIFLLPAFGEIEFFFGRGDQGEYFPAFEHFSRFYLFFILKYSLYILAFQPNIFSPCFIPLISGKIEASQTERSNLI